MKNKVFVTRVIPQQGIDLLKESCDVTVNEDDRVLSREELICQVKDCQGLLCLLTDQIDSEVFDANPNLKVVANYAVGYNNIDIKEATKRSILVTNTPGVLTDTTADLAWALLMAVTRRVVEADEYTRAGKFKGWGPMLFLGGDVYGKSLGIIGLGRIGQAMAKRARGFDMNVYYFDENRKSEDEEYSLGVSYSPLEELLEKCDFISLHVPLLPSTHHLMGEEEFDRMKETAYLINTARGPVVDERALVKALKTRNIAGAGLDVFEEEPALAPGLAELDNVVIVPHIASASMETRAKMATMAANNIIAALEGKRPPNIVND